MVSDVEVVAALVRGTCWARPSTGRTAGRPSCCQLLGQWLLLVTGGEPTADKPTVTFAPPPDPDAASAELIFGVADCRAAYGELDARGAEFLTPPVEYPWEIRAFFRDPDGHLFEISEARNRG